MVDVQPIPVHDGRFEYETEGPTGCSACCIRIYETPAYLILVASEVDDNPGASITNTAAALATALVARYGIDPRRTVFIEYWTHAAYQGMPRNETYDVLSFVWRDGRAKCSSWRRLDENDLRALGLPARDGMPKKAAEHKL